MQKQSPLLRLWELGKDNQGGLIRAIISASIGVLCGILPYYSAAQMIIGLLARKTDMRFYTGWCLAAFAGFAIRGVLYALALAMSHKATFSILKSIRECILKKLPRMPLGTVTDTPSGQMKQIIVDQVDSMERPLAHLLPEMTANILGPVCILVYLFVLDWRMALLSLASIPVGMVFMMAVMKNYGEQYEGSVKVTQDMNAAIVEYIGGIEVSGCTDYTAYNPACRMADVPAWKSFCGDLYHHHYSFSWYCRPLAGGHGFCGQSREGGDNRGGSGFDSEWGRAGSWRAAGTIFLYGYPGGACFLWLSRRQRNPA